jgi:hypothetical protein
MVPARRKALGAMVLPGTIISDTTSWERPADGDHDGASLAISSCRSALIDSFRHIRSMMPVDDDDLTGACGHRR